jgi:hypothetical protein
VDVTKDMRLDHSPEIVLEQDTFNVICAYTLYVRLEEHLREDLEVLLQDISKDLSRRGTKWVCRECIKIF